jgi:glycosyltransferase involved in cell wall biosynthesis
MISVVIPTYNSERTLEMCLESIVNQDYPKEKIEIIIADGGSTDRTLEIARKYTDKIINNRLKTGEAGKAVGIKHAKGDIIALIDSDNILPTRNWLRRMIKPFEDVEIAGAEPLYYTYRKQDGYITRYCALIGMNDPLCLFIGNYDRYNLLTGKWTGLKVKQEDKGEYLKIELDERAIPTIGANGFLIRREMLEKCSIGDYLFDIDVVYELVKQSYNKFAKVKVGIVHIFSGNISTFVRKQRRRIKDYAYYRELGLRKYPWSSVSKGKLLKFISYTVFTLPLLVQAMRGYMKKPDIAWFFHIPACWTTLIVYALGNIQNYLFGVEPEDRNMWSI